MANSRITTAFTLCTMTLGLLLLGACAMDVNIDMKPPWGLHIVSDSLAPQADTAQVMTVTVPVTVTLPVTSLQLVNVYNMAATMRSDALGVSYRVDVQKVVSTTSLTTWLGGLGVANLGKLQPKLALAHQLTETVPITLLIQGKATPLTLFMMVANISETPPCIESQNWVWQEAKVGTASPGLNPPANDYNLLVASAPIGTLCLVPDSMTLQNFARRASQDRNVWVDFLLLEDKDTHKTQLIRLLKAENEDTAGGGSQAQSAFCAQWECSGWLGEGFCYIVGC